MDNAARKIDDDGIDTEFESAIGKALEDGANDPAPFRPNIRLAGVKSVTPLERTQGVLGRAYALCTRLDALCDALVGGSIQGAKVKSDEHPNTSGLMGKLARSADQTDVRIAAIEKRLDELERITLGHVYVSTQDAH